MIEILICTDVPVFKYCRHQYGEDLVFCQQVVRHSEE